MSLRGDSGLILLPSVKSLVKVIIWRLEWEFSNSYQKIQLPPFFTLSRSLDPHLVQNIGCLMRDFKLKKIKIKKLNNLIKE